MNNYISLPPLTIDNMVATDVSKKAGQKQGKNFLNILIGSGLNQKGAVVAVQQSQQSGLKSSSDSVVSRELNRELYEYGTVACNKLSYVDWRVTKVNGLNKVSVENAKGKWVATENQSPAQIVQSSTPRSNSKLQLNSSVGSRLIEIEVLDNGRVLVDGKLVNLPLLPETTKMSLLYSGEKLAMYIRDNVTEISKLKKVALSLLKQINLTGAKLVINGKEV